MSEMANWQRRAVLKGLVGGIVAGATLDRAHAAPTVDAERAALETILDPSAEMKTLFTGGRWLEGPCYLPDLESLVFSDVKTNRMWRLGDDGSTETFRDPSENANGNVLDGEGRLVTCEHRRRQVVRQEPDGSITVLADRYDGKRLNSPNDAVLAPDGAIWFTDPTYGITQPEEGIPAEPEQSARRVYRIDPSGRLDAKTDTLRQPNGIAISADGRTLYVSETGGDATAPNGIVRFTIGDDGALADRQVFALYDKGVPDGLALDIEGRLYAGSIDGVRIFDEAGRPFGLIPTPKPAANLAFGGPDGRRLFVTATDSVHAIDLKVPGIEWRKR
ncbi:MULTISPECIES: SMP-30/gluconolactonase/LRE family protein [unclassified Aureimonas]|uniref:SMP-30/gluconolactonase/LRE family protein n=1 Tax=unclassified Aureimonas TaxID=2615206 RepID=UPI0006FF62B5|nr:MULTISPECIES: SMP-30/gluconolactonase/LRE family protein [unclassified Aureimonas]KQT53030.1 gluconolactonase [Aureimonas sp. Leaf427]KQT80486.1 gluconolactonase [Aureimonas sp. Leaf460]